MIDRIILTSIVILGIPPYVSAQAPAEAGPQRRASDGDRVVLEMRWLALNHNYPERAGTCPGQPPLKDLPGMGAYAVYDALAAQWLVKMASGDRRVLVGPVSTVTVVGGDEQELPPFSPTPDILMDDGQTPATRPQHQVIQASMANDRQAFQIRWKRNDGPDGEAPSAAVTATVPVGKYLLLHTHDALLAVQGIPATPSYWDRFFNRKPRTVGLGRERLWVFLVVMPHVAVPEEEQGQSAMSPASGEIAKLRPGQWCQIWKKTPSQPGPHSDPDEGGMVTEVTKDEIVVSRLCEGRSEHRTPILGYLPYIGESFTHVEIGRAEITSRIPIEKVARIKTLDSDQRDAPRR